MTATGMLSSAGPRNQVCSPRRRPQRKKNPTTKTKTTTKTTTMNNSRPKITELPAGKSWQAPVTRPHASFFLWVRRLCTPNGDPDAGNMARIEADSGKGLVTDVCLKRKQRNFFSLFDGEGNPLTGGKSPEGYDIFVKENAVLQRAIKDAYSIRSRAILRASLDELSAAQFLTAEAVAEAFAELDSELPDEPGKCAKKVVEIVAPKLDFNPYAAAVASKLREKQGVPPEVVTTIEQIPLAQPEPNQPRPGESEVRKAIVEALKRSLPNARIPTTLKKPLEQAFDEASPQRRLEVAHEGIRLEDAVRRELCRTFIDIRAFGAVVSTKGPLEGSFYGQIRGPLQFTFSESLDKVLPLDPAITRCAVASEDEKNPEEGSGNRTMGRKHGIVYGLYRCHIHFSDRKSTRLNSSHLGISYAV